MKSIPLIRITFLIMAAVLFSSLAATYLIGRETIVWSEEISAREGSLRQIQEVFSTLQDAETGQRGFLLTGRQEYLGPYRDALDDLPTRLRHLRNAALDGEIPLSLVERFQQLADEKIVELKGTIDAFNGQGASAATTLVLTDAGRKKMDDIRAVFGEIVADEEKHLVVAEQALRDLVNLRTVMFLAAVALNLAFLMWAYLRIRKEIARRYVADLEARRHREILAVSLASIGDAVILTDTEANVVFLNDVAEKLTAWPRAEAVGQPCAKVFHIINETTRVPVESPVDLVLRTGKTVGLANHTLLIRKDGTEVPIDDSGAPVREADGALRGVVLVFRDFSQHKNSERELRETKERLEVANQAKDNFIAALSHELRTPLTPVLGTLSSWESNRTLPEPLATDVSMLTRNVRLEVRLIDDLLDLTRISRGEITLHKERVDAHALLAAVVEIFRQEIDNRQIRVGVRPMAQRHFVEADPARLQQVFWNILGNAVKFTPAGGRIEIVTSNEAEDLRVTFADNGRGIPAEDLKHLFQPFERSVPRVGYQSGGLGIGLTISQNLIQAHGGSIAAESAGPDLGSTFTARIPALAANPTVVTKNESGNVEGEAKTAPLAILLVEDHADSALVISRIVRNMGHTVTVSHSVADALTELRAQKFDLVLSDIGLPDGTGIQLLATARGFTNTPMIALTGYGMEDDLAKYREAGFLHQLTKPIRFEQLEKLLQDFALEHKRPAELKVRPTS